MLAPRLGLAARAPLSPSARRGSRRGSLARFPAALAPLALLAWLLVFSVPASGAGARQVLFPQPVENWTLIVVPYDLLAPFTGLYVSSDPLCASPLPTWWLALNGYVLVVFNATGGDTYYLCYGDLAYTPANPFTLVLSSSGEVALNPVTGTVSGSDYPATFMSGGSSTGYTVLSRPRPVLASVTGSATLYGFPATVTLTVYADGVRVASVTETVSGWATVTVTSPYTEGSTFELWITVNDGTAYLYSVEWNATYYEWTCSYEPVGAVYENMILLGGSGIVVLDAGNWSLVLSEGSLNGTQLGTGARIVATPGGSGGYGSQASVFDPTLEYQGGGTVYAGGCGYNGTVPYTVDALGVNVTYVDGYVIGQEYQPQPTGAGAGGAPAGNVSLAVSIDTSQIAYGVSAAVLMSVAFYLAAMAFVRNSMEMFGVAMIPLAIGTYMMTRLGELNLAYVVTLIGAGLFIAFTFVELARRLPRWLF